MNFGDILDEWESQTKADSKKKKSNSTGQEWRNKKPESDSMKKMHEGTLQEKSSEKKANDFEKKIDPMELWLRRYGVVDKDAITEKIERENAEEDKATLRKKTPDAVIDLHGLTRDEAWTKLENFVTECARRRLRKIQIIHGKGNHSDDNPVLSAMVRTFIEKDHRLGESGFADRKDGGKGATWVLIRESAFPQN